MAKRKQQASKAGKLAGKSVAFIGKFGYGTHLLDALKGLVAAEGGLVVEAGPSPFDYLVAGTGVGGNPPAAVAKMQKKHPHVQVLDLTAFYQLVSPTAEEFQELMLSGSRGHEFWNSIRERLWRGGVVLDLAGTDFRKCAIEGTLHSVCLDACDFRGAKISAHFDKIKGAKFDGAKMTGGAFSNAEDCSLKSVTMHDIRWNPATFVRCDFTGAKLQIGTGSYTTTTDCVFAKAHLSKSCLDNSKFTFADFSGAVLTEAHLEKCDFTGADLTGADFSRADLRNTTLINANLREACFKDAMLTGADLTGADIEGADFTGANLTGANLTGLDFSLAKNLESKPARTAGPNMRELAKVASSSQRLTTSVELRLGPDEHVTLEPSLNHYGAHVYVDARYSHVRPKHNLGSGVDAPSFEQGMLNLADLWSRGTPDFETVKVEAKKCPLRGKELKELAIAAWHEACGLEVPTADELQAAAEKSASETATLRELLIAELEGGAVGVAKWNARSEKERGKLGKLRKHDFTNAKLAGANLQNQDLEGCKFDGASLQKAFFCNSQLKQASFAQADLNGANLASCKASEAAFEEASLTNCNLCAANFRRSNFQNSDLSGSDFSFSDLCGADFRGATLQRVTYLRTKFDDGTIFPPGFVPPDGLDWKGTGARPGTPAPLPPPKSGTLDFDAFLELLSNRVELARMQKAGSMLKAERFQLFADVQADFLVGVVKSQTNQDLVYSCRLDSAGAFGCCTQNLRPCGGLRGALCKHLLVLIVGLAKAGQLDPATVDHWVDLSKRHKPAIDEDAMSATFLRFKGAEAGEIDWRPTETIPEDFYAM